MPKKSADYPSYLNAYESGKLKEITDKAYFLLKSCNICPRKCSVDRQNNKLGFCKTGLRAKVCSILPHYGEEPPISGTKGSGTIFFSHCNMSCVYCQNYQFSQLEDGREVEHKEIAEFMIKLQSDGCHNINLVTPTHIMPQILKSLELAISFGLKIPLVYNTSGYELPEMIKLLKGIVDIYLADARYANEENSRKYSCAPDYPNLNKLSLKEMHRQVGIPEFDDKGIVKKGLIIRHLVLPNNISGSKEIFKFISEEISPDTYISLMSQYFPCYKALELPELNRRISLKEYNEAQKAMEDYELHNGWTQDSSGLNNFAGTNIKMNI